MATGVAFGSPRSIIYQPGAYSLVDASALAFTPPFSFNTVCVLGAAIGGKPFTPYLFQDGSQAQSLFGAETPAAELARFAFMGGVNGGAASVVGMRIDNAGQASGSLVDAETGTELTATFDDWGAYGNTFSLGFFPATTEGTMAVVQGTNKDGSEYKLTIDNQPSFSNLINLINQRSPLTVALTAGGTKASQTLTLATSQVDGRAPLTDGQGTARVTQAYLYQFPESMLQDALTSLIASTDQNTNLVYSISEASAGAVVSTHGLTEGSFVYFDGDAIGNLDEGTKYVLLNDTGGTSFTVSAADTTVLAFAVSGIAANTITAPGQTFAVNDVVRFIGDNLPAQINESRNYFVVSSSGDNITISTTHGGSVLTISNTNELITVRRVATGTAITVSGTFTNARAIAGMGYTTISGSSPSDFDGIREATQVIGSYSQVLAANLTISDSAYSSDSARFTLGAGDTWGYVEGKGMPGSMFTIALGVYAGTYQVLHHEFDGLGSDLTRIVRKLTGDRTISGGSLAAGATFAWRTTLKFARIQPANTALETELPANGLLTRGGQYLTLVVGEQTYHYATQQGDRIEDVGLILANFANADEESRAVVSSAYNASTYTSTLTVTAKAPGTADNTLEVSLLVNVQAKVLVTSQGATLDGGVDPLPPRNAQGDIAGSLILKGGYNSAPTYQDYITALEEIAYLGIRYIVVATDNIGVQVAIADHCAAQSSTPKRRERMCVLGHGRGWTMAMVRQRSELFNSERVVFVSPDIQMPDPITGLPRWYESYYTAARVAGALAAEGNGISDSVTHTYLQNIIDVGLRYQGGSNDLDQAIISGVLTIERDASLTRQSRGWRITFGVTTFRVVGQSALKSNVFEAINIVNQSDFIAADIREMEEALFIGTVYLPGVLEQIEEAINKRLQVRTQEGIIYGFNPGFTKVAQNIDNPRAFDAVYEIYPAPEISFILNTQLLSPIPTNEAVTVIS